MAKIKIGKIPVYKGEYDNNTRYDRLNQVTYLGTTFLSIVDDNLGHPPAEKSEDGGEILYINTNYWDIVAKGIDNVEERTATGNSMGYKILKKNKSFIEQVTEENTIYEIRYNFTLTEDITIPANCVLKFDGGSVSGAYNIIGNNTLLICSKPNTILQNVNISGTFCNDTLDLSIFQIVNNGIASSFISSIISCFTNLQIINFPKDKIIRVNSSILFNNEEKIIHINGNNCTLKGEGDNGFIYLNITSKETIVENLSIDNSACDAEFWDYETIEGMKFFRGINNSSEYAIFRNINISDIWGYGINCSKCSKIAEVSNVTLKNVGGMGKTTATDNFGDALYFGISTGNELINVSNVKAIGKVNSAQTSRIGITIESLGSIEDSHGILHLNISNCDFQNFMRSVHIENILNEKVLVNVDNSEFQNSAIHFHSYGNTKVILSTNNSYFICNDKFFLDWINGFCNGFSEAYIYNCYIKTGALGGAAFIGGKINVENSKLDLTSIISTWSNEDITISKSNITFSTNQAGIISSNASNIILLGCSIKGDGNQINMTLPFKTAIENKFDHITPKINNSTYNNTIYTTFPNIGISNANPIGNNILYMGEGVWSAGSDNLRGLHKSGIIYKKDIEEESIVIQQIPVDYGINSTIYFVIIPYLKTDTEVTEGELIHKILYGGLHYVIQGTHLTPSDNYYTPNHNPIILGNAESGVGASFSWVSGYWGTFKVKPNENNALAFMCLQKNEITLLPDGDKFRNFMIRPDRTPCYLSIDNSNNISVKQFNTATINT